MKRIRKRGRPSAENKGSIEGIRKGGPSAEKKELIEGIRKRGRLSAEKKRTADSANQKRVTEYCPSPSGDVEEGSEQKLGHFGREEEDSRFGQSEERGILRPPQASESRRTPSNPPPRTTREEKREPDNLEDQKVKNIKVLEEDHQRVYNMYKFCYAVI